MISEEEKQKMIAFLRNPQPIELHFEKTDVPPDLFKMMGIDDTFSHDYHFEYGADEDDEITVWPDRIVKSGRATIVFWEDGTKTVVKRSPDESDNEYNAFLAALGIKIFGSNSKLKKIIKEKTVVQNPKKWKAVYDKEPIAKDACPIDKHCEKSTVEHDLDAMNRHDEDWHEILDKLPDSENEKLIETLLKEAEGRKYPPAYYIFKAMSGEKDKELEDRLNKQAKKQYEEYLKQNTANDMWTCPKCGKRYQWQYNAEGRYAFCPHCQLATKTEAKA